MINNRVRRSLLIIIGSFCFLHCTKSTSTQENKSQASASKCAAPQVTCTVANGSGSQTCTNSQAGPTYGDCMVDTCSSGFYMSGNQCKQKSFALSVTGGNISMPTSNFTAISGQTYVLRISGAEEEAKAGLANENSYLEKESGHCKGKKKYQPFTLNLSGGGVKFQFEDNNWHYSKQIAKVLGGCTWKLCAESKTGSESCVTLHAGNESLN